MTPLNIFYYKTGFRYQSKNVTTLRVITLYRQLQISLKVDSSGFLFFFFCYTGAYREKKKVLIFNRAITLSKKIILLFIALKRWPFLFFFFVYDNIFLRHLNTQSTGRYNNSINISISNRRFKFRFYLFSFRVLGPVFTIAVWRFEPGSEFKHSAIRKERIVWLAAILSVCAEVDPIGC